MKSVEKIIREHCSEEALQDLIRYYTKLEWWEEVYFLEDVSNHCERWIERKIREDKYGSNDIHIFSHQHPENKFSFVDSSLLKTKYTYEIALDWIEHLREINGIVHYIDDDFTTLLSCRKHFYMKELLPLIDTNKYNSWSITEAWVKANVFNWDTNKREMVEHEVLRLTHDNGTQMTFTLPHDRKEYIHCLFFVMPEDQQKGYFNTKKYFQNLWELLAIECGQLGIESICLGKPLDAPPVKGNEWRFTELEKDQHEVRATKLLRYWQRMGGVLPCLEDSQDCHPDRLYFATPEQALKVKEQIDDKTFSHLYKYLRHSIYGSELEAHLLS